MTGEQLDTLAQVKGSSEQLLSLIGDLLELTDVSSNPPLRIVNEHA